MGVKCLPSLCNVIRRRGVVSKKGGRGGEREEKEICSILNIISRLVSIPRVRGMVF